MKRIALVGLTGWAGIVWLAWTLANNRIDACRYEEGYTCELRVTAARDAVLTNGLTVALVGLLVLMLVTVRPDQRGRLSRLRPTLPAALNSVRARRWSIGVAAAAVLSSIVWFIAWPVHWFGPEIVPADTATIVASDAVTVSAAAPGGMDVTPTEADVVTITPVEGDPFSRATDEGSERQTAR